MGPYVWSLLYSCIGWDPVTPPLPRIWAHIRGRYWSAEITPCSTPTAMIADEFFPIFLKMEQPTGKARVRGRGGSWLYVLEQTFYGAYGQPHAGVDFTPIYS